MADRPIDQKHSDWVLSALERYECPLTRYAVRLVGDRDVARDAVQHAFLKLCDVERAQVDDHLAAWLYTVCRNKALDLIRGRDRVEPLNGKQSAKISGREADPTETAEQHDLSIWVGRLLEELPGSQR
jgi:RNA polymerase sigma factor (sigma-70 family)